MKSKIAFAVAIGLAILTAIGIKSFMTQERQRSTLTQDKVKVLKAAANLKKGTFVKGDMVREEEVPAAAVGEGALTPTDLMRILTDKTPILRDVTAGNTLFASYFFGEAAPLKPEAGLSPGYRAITIPVDKVTGCAGRLLPGSLVDVLATLSTRLDPSAPIQPVTQTVLTDMPVLATDLNVREPYNFTSARERADYASYSTVTLRANQLEAVILAFLVDQGKIHLVVRAPDDPRSKEASDIDKVSLKNLDELMRKAAAEKAKDRTATPLPTSPE